jgi:hypothetical protein
LHVLTGLYILVRCGVEPYQALQLNGGKFFKFFYVTHFSKFQNSCCSKRRFITVCFQLCLGICH